MGSRDKERNQLPCRYKYIVIAIFSQWWLPFKCRLLHCTRESHRRKKGKWLKSVKPHAQVYNCSSLAQHSDGTTTLFFFVQKLPLYSQPRPNGKKEFHSTTNSGAKSWTMKALTSHQQPLPHSIVEINSYSRCRKACLMKIISLVYGRSNKWKFRVIWNGKVA